MFTQKFADYVCEGDYIECEVDGFKCRATLYLDDDTASPPERGDGFWPSQNPNDTGYVSENFDEAMTRAKEVLKAWETGEWHYYGVAVTVSKKGIPLIGKYIHALWGIEGNYPGSNNDYLVEVANDILPEAIRTAKDTIKNLSE
jgi:hypothetical protein